MTAVSALNWTVRFSGYSQSEMFLSRRLRSPLPDIRNELDLKEALRFMEEKHAEMREHTEMRENMRKKKPRSLLALGELVLLYKETGSQKSLF